MTLKDLIKDILEVDQGCRNDYKKLIWRVWQEMGFVDTYTNSITFDKFMEAPQPESIRRPAQQAFRSDKLLGENKIQPNRRIKENREKLAKEKGVSFIMGKTPVFNPITQTYEI